MSDFRDSQVALNRSTSDAWQHYATHRRQVQAYLLDEPGSALTVLGAGNCNDMDLSQLLQTYETVRLVDVDRASVEAGLRRQGLTSREVARAVIIERDFTEVMPLVDEWLSTGASSEPEPVQQLCQSIRGRATRSVPIADVVLATPSLSQVLGAVAGVLQGPADPRLRVMQELRWRYLRAFTACLAPRGRGILLIDFVSSDTTPLLLAAQAPNDPGSLATSCLAEGNFFTGCHPLLVADILRADRAFGCVDVRVAEPWIWGLSEARRYLVQPIVVRKA